MLLDRHFIFFKEKKNRLIYLLKHHVNLDDIETFVFMIRFNIITQKINPDGTEDNQDFFISSP